MNTRSKYSRRLAIEALENRSLLSAVVGVAPDISSSLAGAVAPPAAQAGPLGQTPTAAASLVILLPPCVPSGVPVQIMALAVDASNHPVPGYTGTAALTSSDSAATSGGAALPVNVTFVSGRAFFPVTFAATGTVSLTLTDSTNSIGGTASTTVGTAPSPTPTPTAATQLALQMPPSVPSGMPVQIMALAEDASGHPTPSYSGTATLAITGGTATLNGTALPATITITNGQAPLSLVFTSTGAVTLSLTDNATTGALTAASVNVTVNAPGTPPQPPKPPAPPTAAAATQLALMLPPTVPSGQTVMVMAAAEDASGHPTPNYSGTATLAITGGTATVNGTALPYTVTIANGMAQIPVVFTSTGAVTLTLTDNATTGALTTATAAVTVNTAPTAGAATQLAILLPPPPPGGPGAPGSTPVVPTGVAVPLTLAIEDANGLIVPGSSDTATLAITGGTATSNGTALPATVTITNGQIQLPVDFTSTGTVTLTLTDNATTGGLTTCTITLQVSATLPPPPPPGQ